MVELAESVPDHEQIQKGPIQYLYAFALSRRNLEGDRDKAISILERVLFCSFCIGTCLFRSLLLEIQPPLGISFGWAYPCPSWWSEEFNLKTFCFARF